MNSDKGDGCHKCKVEYGWECSGNPSICHQIFALSTGVTVLELTTALSSFAGVIVGGVA